MLLTLSVRDIVLIRKLDIELGEGFCALTGETGAGKSILLDALGLALGMRAEAGLVRSGAESASASASFDIQENERAQAVLEELGMEVEHPLVVRRVLAGDGKSRAFVNDQPVGVAALKALGEALVEIHGQHDQRGLLSSTTHRALLDAYAKAEKDVAAVRAAYRQWKETAKALEAALAAQAKAKAEEEYLRHRKAELSKLAPEEGEEEKLAATRQRGMQSAKLMEAIGAAHDDLRGDKGALYGLRQAQKALSRLPQESAVMLAPAVAALERAELEAAEAADALERAGDEAVCSPRELEKIEERLFTLRDFARKYHVPVSELPALLAQSEQEIALLDKGDAAVKELAKQTQEAKQAYQAKAEKLSALRAKASKKLEAKVVAELAKVKMEKTRFSVTLTPLPEEAWQEEGMDGVQFLAATNPGAALSSLSKIASGGELSRFMLACKIALAEVGGAATLIFDEVDTGIGGAVADAVGERLAELGKVAQVLVVTHQPQVAAKAEHHYRIQKKTKAGAAVTDVEELDAKGRREEVARMLAGAEITDEARAAASKLMAVD